MSTLGIARELDQPFDAVVAKLPEVFKTEGFGVLTTVDIQKTLKEKIGADFRRYSVFGVCNPHFALRGLSKHLEFGLMMPCNVVVHELDGGRTLVRAIDPTQTFANTLSPEGAQLAGEVRAKLASAVAKF